MIVSRVCPNCGGTEWDVLFSINKIYCFTCRTFHPYKLKKGQKSILIKGLIGGDSKPSK